MKLMVNPSLVNAHKTMWKKMPYQLSGPTVEGKTLTIPATTSDYQQDIFVGKLSEKSFCHDGRRITFWWHLCHQSFQFPAFQSAANYHALQWEANFHGALCTDLDDRGL